MEVTALYHWLDIMALRYVTGLCVFARFGGLFVAAPMIGGARVPNQVRLGLAGAIALVITPLLRPVTGTSAVWLGCAVGKEILVGLMLGWTAATIVSCGQMAGEWLDTQGGFQAAHILNPATDVQSSPLGNVKSVMAGLLFFGLGGPAIMVRAAARSFDLSPAGALTLTAGSAGGWTAIAGQVMWTSLQLAMPVAAALFLADLGFAIASRALPQMNVLLLSAPVKTALAVGGLTIALPTVAWLMQMTLGKMPDVLDGVLRMMG